MTPERTRQALRRLALDAVAVEVVRELRRRGIEPILLKGPSIARRLYRDAGRAYRDVDLLVAPEQHERAGGLLAALGFTDVMDGARPHERCHHARTFMRPGGRAIVDLHLTLFGAAADPSVVWSALGEHIRPLWIGMESMEVLDDVALALHIAMHAAQHGIAESGPIADLRRALCTFDIATFEAAASLAVRIEALPQFVTGLRLVPEGQALARTVGAGVGTPAATSVQALTKVRGVGSVGTVLAEPVWRRPLVVGRRAFPSRTVLRRSMPLARRGRVGLAAAYAVRPFWMAAGLPAAVRAWRAAANTWRD